MSSRYWFGRRVLIGGAAITASASLVVGSVVLDAGSAAAAPTPTGAGRHLAPATSQTSPPKGPKLPTKGSYTFLLELKTTPTLSRFDAVRRGGTKAEAKAAAKAQLGTVREAQQRVESKVADLPGSPRVLYTTHAAMAAVAVRADVTDLDALKRLPGVVAAYPVAPKVRDNSYAVPFQGAPAAWADDDGSGRYLGKGVVVADIDSGLDYTHADFGGPGTSEAYDYEAAHDTDAPRAEDYDANKFDAADSWDLVGDDYQPDDSGQTPAAYQPTPHPDGNPLDCSVADGGDGHGTHTAGTIAGYGVKDGAKYDGPYDPADVSTADAGQFEIGPGMAPLATLESFRVFGCQGPTDVLAQAIDLALDPHGNGSGTGRPDVINISIGSDFGSAQDGDAVAAQAAVEAGVTVAVAAGNAYDEYDAAGSPGTAPGAITVAASQDAQSITDGTNVTIGSDAEGPYPSQRAESYQWGNASAVGGGDLHGAVAAPQDDPTGCHPLDTTDRARVNDKIAFLTWDDDDPVCSSSTAAANARQAGAVGFVLGSNKESFIPASGISGDAGPAHHPEQAIPGVLVNRDGAQAISAALDTAVPVQIDGTTVASVTDTDPSTNDEMTDFSSRGLRTAGNLKPDVTAVGATVFSALPGSGTHGQDMSGTSMATPMVAGLAALVHGAHPGWTPEQVKADIMNTADANLYVDGAAEPSSDRYAPMRAGAGRIDAATALSNDVLAFTQTDTGTVSASFGPLAVTAPTTRSRTIELQNTGAAEQHYTAAFDQVTGVPGVTYSVSPQTVTVPAGGAAEVTLTLSIPDPSELATAAAFDPTHGDVDPVSGMPMDTVAEASGNVTFTPTDGSATPALRVPAYAAPRPASTMTQPAQLSIGATHTVALPLTGGDVGYGNGSAAIDSLAAGFELQATSPALPACTSGVASCIATTDDSGADLKDLGTTSDGDYLYFAIVTQGAHSTPASKVEFDIYLDTTGDGVPDLVAYNTRYGDADVFVENLVDLDTGQVVDTELLPGVLQGVDTAIYDSDVLVVPVALGNTFRDGTGQVVGYGLGHYLAGSTVRYGVQSFGTGSAQLDEVGLSATKAPQIPVDVAQPAITVADGSSTGPFVHDQAGARPTLTENPLSYAADGGLGLLMVHFHNVVGDKAQVVALATPGVPPVIGPAPKVRPTVVLKVKHRALPGKRLKVKVKVKPVSGVVATGRVRLKGAGGHHATKLRHGKAVFLLKPKRGRLHLKAKYGGNATYLSAHSPVRTVRVR